MGILDIFKSAPAPAVTPASTPASGAPVNPANPQAPGAVAVPAAPIQPGNIQPLKDAPAPGNGVVPGSTTPTPAEPKVPESPLDQFKDLWQAVPVDANSPTPAVPAELTAEQVQQAVSKASFTESITPEQLTAIAAGGEEAQKAFTEAMNSVAQQVMVQATMVSNKLTERAVSAALEKQNALIPEMLRKQASTAHLNDTSELFSNPAIQPVVQATQAQLLQKFPNATPLEITTMTQDFIVAMGEQFSPKASTDSNDTDWSNFLK